LLWLQARKIFDCTARIGDQFGQALVLAVECGHRHARKTRGSSAGNIIRDENLRSSTAGSILRVWE
jgi:hypothetical protein